MFMDTSDRNFVLDNVAKACLYGPKILKNIEIKYLLLFQSLFSCWHILYKFKEWFHILSCWLFQRKIFFRALRPFVAFNNNPIILTAQKMKFSIRDFFSKCDQIRRKLQIWSDLLNKSVLESLIFVQWLIM